MNYKDKAIEFANDIVHEMAPAFENNCNGPDWYSCRICSAFLPYNYGAQYPVLKHDPDCLYVKAQKFLKENE